MDSSSCDQLPSPMLLKSLACDVKYPHGNYLIHQFVLNCSERRKSCSESDIRAALRSFPGSRVNVRNEDGFTPLHLAVMNRSSFMVKMLLSSCLPTIDVNAKCAYFEGTALHLAAGEDFFGGAFSNAKKYYGKTQLDKDVKGECLEIINILLANCAIIDIKDNRGITPLHVAAKENEIDIIQLLISNGAELNYKDDDGKTPLHHAIWGSGLETVKLLLESGADINEKSDMGCTPLHLAVRANLRDIIKYLISKNVDLNTVDHWGETPLHTAVLKGRSLEMVSDLVKSGALLNLKDVNGKTALHIAAKENQIDILKLLISNGAELGIQDTSDETPLHQAVEGSGLEAVKILVESGADLDGKCQYNRLTPFHLAVRAGKRDITEYLISKHVDLNTVNVRGNTPLHSAVRIGSLEMVEDLVRNGALLNVEDSFGQTPLHDAAAKSRGDITEFLIGSGADVKAKDSNGRTPLHVAVSVSLSRFHWDNLEAVRTVEVLVKSGADVEAADKNGESPLSIAERQNWIEVVGLFKSRVTRKKTSRPKAASSHASVFEPPLKKRRD